MPTATFQLVKSDGSVELRKFQAHGHEHLLAGLAKLATHADAIGARGLLAHIVAVCNYLDETDEADAQLAKADTNEVAQLKKRIAELEAQPMPAKGVMRFVDKQEDGHAAPRELAKLSSTDRAHELMKIALANPVLL